MDSKGEFLPQEPPKKNSEGTRQSSGVRVCFKISDLAI